VICSRCDWQRSQLDLGIIECPDCGADTVFEPRDLIRFNVPPGELSEYLIDDDYHRTRASIRLSTQMEQPPPRNKGTP